MDVDAVQSYHFGDKLLLAVSDKFMKLNENKPLTFEAKIENKKLVLAAALPGLARANFSDPEGESDGST